MAAKVGSLCKKLEHKMVASNVYVHPTKGKLCRGCLRDYQREYMAEWRAKKKKAAKRAAAKQAAAKKAPVKKAPAKKAAKKARSTARARR